ncbi:MAG TPA: VOC family protein [Gammaproteobacteria bacterium]|nr:VOC family protein [Gammaproteobacteria bacterium]
MNKLAVVVGFAVATSLVQAQPATTTPPAGPAPTGLVVGSGNFYSPIVANLEEAIAFYRGVGFEFQGEPANADANLPLRQMFGLPDAKLRYQIGRAPGLPGGVEIIEISGAGGQRLDFKMQDPGTVMLQVVVRDIDATFARLKAIKAPVVTRGGNPVTVQDAGLRAVVVQDPAGHFIRLVQPPNAAATQPGTGDVRGVRVRHTVENLDRAVALYRDALGLQESRAAAASYSSSAPIADSLGVPQDTQWRVALLTVPTSGIPLELIEFKGARRPQPPDLADPGATRIQLRVADIDAAAAALLKAGGSFISTGGKPLDLPAGNSTLKVGVVRDPDGYFIVLINAPPPAR